MRRVSIWFLIPLFVVSTIFIGVAETATAGEKITLNMWWWGETEKPGAKKWLEETIKFYQTEHPNIKIATVLQTVDEVQSAFRTAARAKDPGIGPDIQFFWPGVYCLADVWSGSVAPMEDYVPEEFLNQLTISKEYIFDGKVWTMPWYTLNWPITYNKHMFADVGLDPESPPRMWEEFVDACERLKSGGYTPIGVGTRDGYFMNWWLNNMGFQEFNNYGELQNLFAEGDVDDFRMRSIFEKTYELRKKGYYNENATSLNLYEGFELQKSEDCAMSVNTFPDWIREMGDKKIGVMLPPIFGKGKLRDKGVAVSSQSFGISSWSVYKGEAADFLMFMMSRERGQAFYKACHGIPARKDFDPSVLETEMEREMYNWIQKYPDNGSCENFIPEKVVFEGLNPAAQLIFSEDYTVDQCIEFVKRAVKEWRVINPDQVENFIKWSRELMQES